MGTKTSKKSAVEQLEATLAKVQAELAALRGADMKVSAAAALRFTEKHWSDLRWNMVVGGKEKPELAKGRKGYALVKNADIKTYMAVKGFAATLASQRINGKPVGLHTEVNDKGRSQVMYAQEVIAELITQGFVNGNSSIITGKAAK